MSTLLAGPWSGEFGWELFAWHAYIRSLSAHFDKTVIVARENSQYLYSDFSDSFLCCEPNTGLADAFFMHGFAPEKELGKILTDNNFKSSDSLSIIIPRRIGWPPQTHYTEKFQFGRFTVAPKYVIFTGNEQSDKYDFIFHARNRDLRREDNWSISKWESLANMLGGKIGCIGTKNESHHIQGTDDLRSINLKELCGIINKSQCVFGPSSGPMHLASLCNTKHVVWSKPDNRLRYEKNWNPHNTPVKFLDKYNWHPSAEYVYESYTQWSK